MNLRFFTTLATLFICCFRLSAADDVIDFFGTAGASKEIPVAISGFSGEPASVIKFDLEAVGVTFVSAEKAKYILAGGGNGRVEGRLTDALSRQSLLAKAYTGGNLRSQAHALADDVIKIITGKAGFGQTKLAFCVEQGGKTELFVSDFDGHSPIQLTQDKNLIRGPAWVPGQRKLYYTTFKSGLSDIVSHDLNSGARKVIAGYGGSNMRPNVSPDGTRVAMVLSKGGNPDLYISNADGTGLRQLTRTRDDESAPCWSPDGQTICFVGRQGGRAALFTISASGGEPRRLNVGPNALNATEPDWSPDGKWIAFTSQMGNFDICVVPARGGEAIRLVAGEDPAWAPNSRTLVFTRRGRSKSVLSLLDVPTKHIKDIAQISGNCSQPSWSR